MRLLLVAATPPELAPTLDWLRAAADSTAENVLHFPRCQVEVMFTGIGLVPTAFALGQRLAQAPPVHLAIQVGVAGAYDRSLELGTVVSVASETLGDLGAEAADGSLLTPAALGFPPGFPYGETGRLIPPGPEAILPFARVAGGTVQCATGTEATLHQRLATFPDLQVETMEGAAFFHACISTGTSALQLRGISNYVESRNREAWQLPAAIQAVNDALRQVLQPFVATL